MLLLEKYRNILKKNYFYFFCHITLIPSIIKMNSLLKSFNFFIISLLSFQYFYFANSTNVLPKKDIVKAPNGPVGLDSLTKLKINSKKYLYNEKNEDINKDSLEQEMNEDILKLKEAIIKSKIPQGESTNIMKEYELNYNFPPWLVEIIKLSNNSKKTLESLGVTDLPDVNKCTSIKNMKEQMLCIIEALEEIKQSYQNAQEITSLTSRILAGGRLAIRALARVKTLISTSENKQLMKALGTPFVTLILIQRETTSDRDRWLAGSILTLLTDLPIISDLSQIQTGSYGHVNVIMPRQSRVRKADKIILRIREGSTPSKLINGYTTMDSQYII